MLKPLSITNISTMIFFQYYSIIQLVSLKSPKMFSISIFTHLLLKVSYWTTITWNLMNTVCPKLTFLDELTGSPDNYININVWEALL